MVERYRRPSGRANNRPPGKPKGARNKTTRFLREAILLAAEEVGMDRRGTGGLVGYLKRIAVAYPAEFCHLLAKVLPLQVHGQQDVNLNVNMTPEQFQQQLQERGIPITGLFDGPAELLPPIRNGQNGHANGQSNGHAVMSDFDELPDDE